MEKKTYLFSCGKCNILVEFFYERDVLLFAKLFDCNGQSLETLHRDIDSYSFTEEQIFDRVRNYTGNRFSISSVYNGELIIADVIFDYNNESICKYFISAGSVVFEEGTECEHYPIDKTFGIIISHFKEIEYMVAQKRVVGKNHSTKCGKLNYMLENFRDFYEHARDIRNLTGRKPNYSKLLKRHLKKCKFLKK